MSATRLVESKSKSPSEVRLVEVLDAYMAAAQEGQAPARDELLAEYPELAEDLEACLASLEFIRQASLSAAPLLADSRSVEAIDGETGIGELGDFKLVAEIGRGGMGVVYEAVQRSLNRRVALKVLPFASAMDPTHLRRFQTEALAAAQLHHTHIVPVYSVGCERGVHYYAMQFIEGQTLAQAIAAQRRVETQPPREGPPPDSAAPTQSAGSGSPGPSSRSREYFRTAAGLGIQAAEALDHAHKFGIVHRDIKPANLLLDVQGSLWVTDFGLARLQDDTGLTITGDLLGTLRYMSPEQALAQRGYLDHRTDIYSLGATLYELVTLRPAVDGRDRQEVLRKIAQDEPAPLRWLNPAIPRELETILLKTLAKEPEARYATAQGLADDLGCFLDDKPIKAKRPTLLERGAKWSRRHSVAVATAVGMLILMTVGLGASLIVISRERDLARQLRGIAVKKSGEADFQRQRAEERAKQARQAVDTMYTEVAEEWLAQQPMLEPLQRSLLEKAMAFYQGLTAEKGDDPVTRQQTAQAYLRVGRIQQKLGELAQAEASLRRATEMGEQLLVAFPENIRYRLDAAAAYNGLWHVLFARRQLAEAEQSLQRAIRILTALPDGSPSPPGVPKAIADSLFDLADQIGRMGNSREEEAEKALRRGIGLMETLVSQSPDSAGFQANLGRGLYNLTRFLRWRGHLDEGTRLIQQAISHIEAALALKPGNQEFHSCLSLFYSEYGGILAWQNKMEEAAHAKRHSIEVLERLSTEFPRTPRYKSRLSAEYGELASLFAKQTKLPEAEVMMRKGIASQEPLVSQFPDDIEGQYYLTVLYQNLGNLLYGLGRSQEAEQVVRKCLALHEALQGRSSEPGKTLADMAASRSLLADIFFQRGELTEARTLITKAIGEQQEAVRQAPAAPYSRRFLRMQFELLAKIEASAGHAAESASAFRRATEVGEALMADHPSFTASRIELIDLYQEMGLVLASLGRAADAELACKRALALAERLTNDLPSQGDSWNKLSWCLAACHIPELRNPARAVQAAKRAIERTPQSGDYWKTLGVAHYRVGDWNGAVESLEKWMHLRADGDATGWFFLAMAHFQKGRKDQARHWYDRAVDSMQKRASQDHELRRYRAEAAALLGVTDRRTSSGKKEEKTRQQSKPRS